MNDVPRTVRRTIANATSRIGTPRMKNGMNNGAKKLGIKEGELGWTLEDNGRVNAGIALMGAKHYKTYRVYEKALASDAASAVGSTVAS